MKASLYLTALASLVCSSQLLASTTQISPSPASITEISGDKMSDLNYRHQPFAPLTLNKIDSAVSSALLLNNSDPYNQKDAQGRYVIDTLIVLTPEAEQEILYQGVSLDEYLGWRIDALNQTLVRSLITNSVVRLVGYHTLTQDDFSRTGSYPNGPLANIGQTPHWLSSYRDAYGADKVMLIGASSEPNNNAAYGGGDFSSYFVRFLPIEHEYGHMMGASHCNNGQVNKVNYGFPLVGYTDDGEVNGHSFAGTRMCGNSVAFYSNPDIELSLVEIEEFVTQGLMPEGDYQPLLAANGLLKMGDETYANFAQVWRNNARDAANRRVATKSILSENKYYPHDNCIGLYANNDYSDLVREVCVGGATELNELSVKSVLIGKNMQINLYSDTQYG